MDEFALSPMSIAVTFASVPAPRSSLVYVVIEYLRQQQCGQIATPSAVKKQNYGRVGAILNTKPVELRKPSTKKTNQERTLQCGDALVYGCSEGSLSAVV